MDKISGMHKIKATVLSIPQVLFILFDLNLMHIAQMRYNRRGHGSGLRKTDPQQRSTHGEG
jgi:hypothetical protein